MTKKKYTFIDLFAGIGGFHTAMHYVGGKCVFASEWDKNARITYETNWGEDLKKNNAIFAKLGVFKNRRYLYGSEENA